MHKLSKIISFSRNVSELFWKYAMIFLCRKTLNKISVTESFNNQSAMWKKSWNEQSDVHHGKIPYRWGLGWPFDINGAGHYWFWAPCSPFGLGGRWFSPLALCQRVLGTFEKKGGGRWTWINLKEREVAVIRNKLERNGGRWTLNILPF